MVSGLNPVDNVAKKSTIGLMHLKSDCFNNVLPQPDENVVKNLSFNWYD